MDRGRTKTATPSIARTLLVFAVSLFSNAQEPQPSSTLGTLGTLASPHGGTAAHEGSWDRKGGNDDFRVVEPGQTLTLLDHQGAGVIRRFWVTIAPRSNRDIHCQAILRMYWDGETTPSVECPIGAFFGIGFGEQRDYISLPLNETSGGYNCYWPMPFHKSAKWTLENRSSRKIDAFYYNIDYTTYDSIAPDQRHFHAQYRRENPTAKGKNYTILDTTGEGHFVGTALFMQGRRAKRLGFLEGDEMVYFDGAEKPAIIGTGTEDYFSSGWYFDRGTYSAPFHGVVIKDEPGARISAYRWHVEDAMPFKRSIRVTIEHGTNNDTEGDYSSVAYYYMTGENPPSPALPADAAALLPSPLPQLFLLKGAIEGESMVRTAKASGGNVSEQDMGGFPGDWSNEAQLWWRGANVGDELKLSLPVKAAGEYEVVGHFCTAMDYGKFAIQIGDGQPKDVDLYHDGVVPSGAMLLGHVKLLAGNNAIIVKVTGKAEASTGYLFGLDAVELKPVK